MTDWLTANLPPTNDILTGLFVGIGTLLGWLGYRKGKNTEAPQKTVELAGAVIDSTDVKALVASHAMLATALRDNTEASRSTAAGIAAIIGEVRRVVDATQETNDRLERIKDELIRSERGR